MLLRVPSSARIIVIIRARRKRRWYNLNYTSHSPVEMHGILTVDYRAQFMQVFSLLLIKSTINNMWNNTLIFEITQMFHKKLVK